MSGKQLITILLVIAVLIVIVLFTGRTQAPTVAPGNNSTSTNPSTGLMVNGDAVYAANQPPGTAVTVQAVALTKPGFVVIHRDENGAPGAVLGASALLPAGQSTNVNVDLNRPSANGEKLYAMLHYDDGDGVFNAIKDAPATGVGGSIIVTEFTIDKNATTTPNVIL